jgi:hypothetical protein
MKLYDKIWLAGFTDGEGCITLHKRKETRYIHTYYQIFPRIIIANTNKNLMLKLYSLTKSLGTLSVNKRRHNPKNWKDCYVLKFIGRKATKFLKMIYPYLKLKKEQARLCFAHYKTVDRNRHGKKLNPRTVRKRETLYLQCKKLNKRGKDN